ncbi:putative thimet oligopeptidase [Camellia lanceoleosa]|uniref:Thimet oligopeptidase n=1 Tax=Camellia lanceoleosa TaxID=1840588 RepID=A0ACC0GAY6_9ERIC|nr:putative thimet oligopeptidase [Camellia lanceoleosa]
MSKQKRKNRNTNLVALTSGAALLTIAVNFAVNALKKNRKKKDLPGSTVQVNLSLPEILRLANRIIAKSKEVHDSIASVPLDKSLDKAENGKFKVTLRSHHVSPILELCKVQLRHKSAGLLRYSNYADYAVNHRMANSSSKVFEFLEELSASLTDLATRELSMLKDLKKKEEGDFPFGIEDLLYYVKRIEEHGRLRFEEIADAEVWHSDVHLYSVYDLSSSELLGYFYLDMFSREGKYGHTCVMALQNGSFVNGARKIPVALLTSQLQKEVGHTALLRFSEVVNLFHEFGNVICFIVSEFAPTSDIING